MTKQQETRKVLFGCIAFVGICGLISSIIYHKEEDNCCVDVVLEPIEKEKNLLNCIILEKILNCPTRILSVLQETFTGRQDKNH